MADVRQRPLTMWVEDGLTQAEAKGETGAECRRGGSPPPAVPHWVPLFAEDTADLIRQLVLLGADAIPAVFRAGRNRYP